MSLRFIFGILCLGIASASLIDMLKAIHQSPSFKQLPHRSQIILIEMLAETEAGELKSYIDLVGFENVINIIDQLPKNESHRLRQYLIQELQIEEQGASTATPQPTMPVVGKRDLVTILKAVERNPAFQHLPAKDQQFIRDMITAAENNQLSAFISTHGYSSVLEIIESLPEAEAHQINHYIFQHMMSEHGAHGVVG